MQTCDPTLILPAEIWLAVFDSFPVAELARFRRVNKRWRDMATAHPCYWGYPQLRDASPAAAEFFLSRLSAAAGKPHGLTVILVEPFPPLETTLLPKIALHLPNITTLVLCVHTTHASSVFGILRNATPSLEFLQLNFKPSPGSDPSVPIVITMPDDILREGHVNTLLLCNVDLPESPPAALAGVCCLVYGRSSDSKPPNSTSLNALAAAFPHLQDLTLLERMIPENGLSASDWPARWTDLAALSLTAPRLRICGTVLQLGPLLAHVEHITVTNAMRLTLNCMLAHLDGALHVSCESNGEDEEKYNLHLWSWETNRVRSFHERRSASVIGDSVARDVLSRPDIAQGVVSLDISLSLWTLLVPLMAEFHNLACLTLVLDGATGLRGLFQFGNEGVIVCPRLNQLTLSSAGEGQVIKVAAEDLERLILERLRTPKVVDLVLRDVWFPLNNHALGSLVYDVVYLAYEDIYPATPWHK